MIKTMSQTAQLAATNLLLGVATIAMLGRLWSRRIKGARLQISDYLMILAYGTTVGLVVALNLAATKGRFGVSASKLSEDIITFDLKLVLIIPILWISANCFIKMSMTHFYLTIFPQRWLQIASKIQFVLLVLFWVGEMLGNFLLCRPFAYNWDLSIEGGSCADFHAFFLSSGIIAGIFDLTCVILPMPVFWNLRLSLSRRLGLMFLFSLGFVVIAVTILRMVYIQQNFFADFTYSAPPAMLFNILEPCLGIVAGCIPLLTPCYARLSELITTTFHGKSKFSSYGRSGEDSGKSIMPTPQVDHFKRLQDHLYPLTDVAISQNTTIVASRGRNSSDSMKALNSITEEDLSQRIQVQHEIYMDSKSQSSSGGL